MGWKFAFIWSGQVLSSIHPSASTDEHKDHSPARHFGWIKGQFTIPTVKSTKYLSSFYRTVILK